MKVPAFLCWLFDKEACIHNAINETLTAAPGGPIGMGNVFLMSSIDMPWEQTQMKFNNSHGCK